MSISKRARDAVYIDAEGRSALSGVPLDEHWEVDHRIPRAAGGLDDVANLQALTMSENRTKGTACPPTLLEWQQEFVARWERHEALSFLLVALPGAGKTIACLWVAHQWIRENPQRRRVIIVVPTDPLRTQWQHEAAALFGLQCQTTEFPHWKDSMVGVIVTYHLVSNNPELWKMRCSQYETLVIADEIHHAGENDWGTKFREAFSLAKRRLLTSGTPFRGDSTRIPFVNYDGEGRCVADYRYDYPKAIRDQVIRVVCFQHERGIVRCLRGGAIETLECSTAVAEREADDALSRILQTGEFTETLLRLAHDKLMDVRRAMPIAGALAICKDQTHAEHIAKQLRQITGIAPALVISDDERSTSTVEAFRASTAPWVVAVRQISEGVDIKRLIVLAYLTNARTPLFFRQAVGRIVRNMRTPEDMEAYCFMPDHPDLVAHARDIVNAQDQAILEESEEDFARSLSSHTAGTGDIVLGTAHTGSAGLIIEGAPVDSSIAIRVQQLASELGVPMSAAYRIWQRYESPTETATPPRAAHAATATKPLEKQLEDARNDLQKTIRRRAYRIFPDDPRKFAALTTVVHQYIGKRSVMQYSLDELHRALAYVESLRP